ncbi:MULTISPECIES: PTS glucose transporter subunit IIA [Anoxybacillus]|uniref:PTS system sucrose-specific transporter subunit II A n=2 Tax=Anoxybacillus TaxID=150247 RepID=R4FE63_9BACL|nr:MULTISPECIES: PTS glucose transporter subunit IIA [Anoxybacillus]QAV25574.1 PTS glucose transporter subunit IIA [Neobacillus thermocopriae]MCL9971657.1 PTS glucose transporter subunit IIA [Anoxybacillus kestanbolensis]NNU90698.1 PTS glucose transporter subunit IIA [Anoxybacillus sp. CHMUD]OOE03193.1 PTS glucose transporter subunit IIA [Anoxybacillus kestanbolensis]GAC91115.1 PTS system sucrose-specific transporter subunit II A [Anoxybacillus flavithermus NBRC 109594]
MFRLFRKREEVIVSPLTGNVRSLENVPDPVFAQKMMGDGFAIEPTDGVVVSPIHGEVVQVFPTKHAVGLRSDQGLEILIHVGIDTVHMHGEGFEAYVKAGDRVKAGDLLLSFDLTLVQQKAKSSLTPVVITNGEVVNECHREHIEQAERGSTVLMKVKLK